MIIARKIVIWVLGLSICLTGTIALAGLEMQAELKREFTQYPGSTVFQVTSAEGTMQVILDCGDESMDAVFEYYKKRAQANGWKIEMENKMPEMYMLMLKRGAKGAIINISSEDGAVFTILSLF